MMQCPYCHDTKFINMGPINPSGAPVFELCECQPPQAPLVMRNYDAEIDATRDRINDAKCKDATP